MKLGDLLNLINKIATKRKISTPLLCGGVVRDKVLNRLGKIEDLDITTGDDSVKVLSKEVSIALGKKYNIASKEMEDGHSSIYLGDLKIDFSSNFNVPNIEEILKKMGIKSPTALQKELYSRDFTCNALLMTLDLKTIIDPTKKGIEDIKNRTIKTCLAPEVTLTSNKNRVVRAIYLAAKLDFDIDPKMVEWVKKHPETVKIASSKTLTEKLNKSLSFNPERTTFYLDQMNLWEHIPITKELYSYYIKRIAK